MPTFWKSDMIDNRVKKPTRKIDNQVHLEVKARDGFCIICQQESIQDIHHVFYGGEKQLDEGRNGVDRLVGLCKGCHHELHYGTKGLQYREKTKEYLKSIYA